jgi:hypothetical protein
MIARLNRRLLSLLTLAGLLSSAATQAAPPPTVRVVHFSGYDWEVRPVGMGGPGPNRWDPSGVWIDGKGWLHLKITRQGGLWQCAELSTKRSLGFGRYQFQVTGRLNRLDKNVVLGLFNYPAPGMGPDGTNEIDIEYSRWGDADAPPASETVYPAHLGLASTTHPFAMPPGQSDTTQRFDWQSDGIAFQSLSGHRSDEQGEYANWSFHPTDQQRLPQQPLPVHINLWLVRGKAPQNGREVEVIVKRFSFVPTTP